MSSRPIIPANSNNPIVNAASMASQVISPVTIIQSLPGLSYDIAWTGTPVGTFAVQVSNTYSENNDGSVRNPGNWNTIPQSAFQGVYPTPSGTSGNGFLDLTVTQAYAVRLVYNPTSSTGNLTVVTSGNVL